ncbi:MAG: YajQ family cyclic di-GMP-binding protein [Gammaproteobacteria bacterium]|jgi:uncharacterized protein YajQ (UPF0234 family)|nr:YajQ family cyclic di-GMP-binding protein [Gammaproteobacteria bacterium]
MPSFDIVSEVDLHELSNAVDQTNREVGNRFDFKGSNARVEQRETVLTVYGENEFQIRQVLDIMHMRMAKRGIELASLSEGDVHISGNKAMLVINVLQGIDQDSARKLIKKIKESKLKVQSSIQGDKVRVSGKKRDDLQQLITRLDSYGLKQPLQAVNFRE